MSVEIQTFQHVEKVQRKLGFCCLWWYNKDGDEDVRKGE